MIESGLITAMIRREVSQRVGHPMNIKVTGEQASRLSKLADDVGASASAFIHAQYGALNKETCLRLFKIPYIPVPVLLSDKAVVRYQNRAVRFIQPKEEEETWQKIKERNPGAYGLWRKSRSVESSQNSSARKNRNS